MNQGYQTIYNSIVLAKPHPSLKPTELYYCYEPLRMPSRGCVCILQNITAGKASHKAAYKIALGQMSSHHLLKEIMTSLMQVSMLPNVVISSNLGTQ